MRWVLALVVVSLLFAPAAFGDLTYTNTTTNFGSGQLVFADSTGDNVQLFMSSLVFNPADNLGQIPDDTNINAVTGACGLTINGGNFNLQENIAGINIMPLADQYTTVALTVALSHVSGYDTALVMSNTGIILNPGVGRGQSIILKGNDIGVAGNGTHFVFANGASGINTSTSGGIVDAMFVVNNGAPDFAVPVAAAAFGANAQEIVGLSQTSITRATDFSGVVGGSTTDHVLLADGNYTVQTGASNTMASLQLKNVPLLNMDFNAVNIASGSMIVTGAGTTTITGNGSIASTNNFPAGGGTSLSIYNTSNLIMDTAIGSNVTLLGTGTITINQGVGGNKVYWLQGSLVWNNDSDTVMTGVTWGTEHAADGGSLTKNGAGTMTIENVINADDSLNGIGNIYINGGKLLMAMQGYSGSVHLGPMVQVNTGGTFQIGDQQAHYNGFQLAAGTIVQLNGGTLGCTNWTSNVPVIDVPAGAIGNLNCYDPSNGAGGDYGHNPFNVQTLTGSGTLRITSNDSYVLANPELYNNWTFCGAGVGIGGGTGSAFTGDVDVAGGSILQFTAMPVNAKSLVVEAGGYAVSGSWGGAANVTLTGQNVRGNGIVSMTGNLSSTQGLSTLTVSGGQVSPGLASGVGKLTVIGNVAFAASSTLNIRVTGSNAVAGVDYDQLVSQENYSGTAVAVTGLANAALHVSIGTNLALKGDVLTIVSAVGGTGATGTLQNFTGSAFGSVVFDNYGVADVTYGNAAITLSRLATAGDVTRNGFVDGGDLNIMLSNWGTGTAGPLTYAMHDVGDVSHNGVVDGGDLNILLSNWGVGVDGQAGVGSAVGQSPEPMTLSLLALGAVGLLRKRRN